MAMLCFFIRNIRLIRKHRSIQVFSRVILTISVLLILSGFTGNYQMLGTRWSAPERIPGYDTEVYPPYLVVDQNRTVHTINSNDANSVIVYSRWTPRVGWSPPTDVLLPPEKGIARVYGAFLDKEGMIHIIFFSGDELSASIYYSSALAVEADRAPAWSTPKLIGEYAQAPSDAVLLGDDQGNLLVLYHGERDGNGLYAIRSEDSGNSWSVPSTVFLTRNDLLWVVHMDGHMDNEGRVHATWTVVNDRGNGDAVYYARLEADHHTWTEPFLVAQREAGDYEADWGSVYQYEGELFLIYQDSAPATRWFRRSRDGGDTWSDPVRPFTDFQGEYGHAVFAVDSSNYLHMFLGNRRSEQVPIHGMWHSVWLGNRWSELEPIIAGPAVSSGPLMQRFDPTLPKVVVSQGNMLFVVWITDGGAGRNGAWFSNTLLDTPELPVVPLPTPMPAATPTTQVISSNEVSNPVVAQPVAPAPSGNVTVTTPANYSPAISLMVAVPVALLLISAVVAAQQMRQKRR